MRILLKDISVLNLEKEEIKNGNITINNGLIESITYLDNNKSVKEKVNNKDFDRVIDGKEKLVTPGFCNSHTHIPMTILRNYADDTNLKDWLNNYIWPAEANINPKDVYWGAMLGIAELLKFGNTCFIDMYFFIDEIGKAMSETKMRGFVSRGLIGNMDERYEQLEETEAFIKNWHGQENKRIQAMIGPHAPYTCPPEYLKRTINLSEKYDLPIHIHLSESEDEVKESIRTYNMTPIEHMESLGMFDRNVLAAHCVKLTDNDIEIIKNNNVNVLYNPISNMKLGNGFARIKDMKEKKINIALGTDGCASNNNMNLLEEIKIASLVNKGISEDPELISAIDALKMGTVNGIEAVGLKDELGSIDVGKKADLTIIDLNKIQTTPKNNIISSLVYSIQSDSIYSTIVDGNILMENGEYNTLDIENIKFEVNKIANRLNCIK